MCASATRSTSSWRRGLVAALAAAALLATAAPAQAQRGNKSEDESSAFVAEARTAILAKRFDDAARALDLALQLNPRRIDAYVLRAAVYQATGASLAGVALMRRARALAPANPDVLARLGSLLLDVPEGQAEGVALLEGVLRERSRPDAFLALGKYWRKRGEYRRAIVGLRSYFSSEDRLDPDTTVELADAYLRARMPRPAKEILAPLVSEGERGGERLDGRLDKVRRQRVLRLDLLIDAALDCAKALPRLAPSDATMALVRGRCALELGRFEEAKALAGRALAEPKLRRDALLLLGDLAAEQKGQEVEARTRYEEAKAADARSDGKYQRALAVRLAALLRRGGDAGTALEQLRRLGPPRHPEEDPRWWLELAQAVVLRDDAAELVQLQRELTGILTEQIREPAAEELFTRAPGKLADARLWALRGQIERRLGETEAAMKSFGASLRLRPLRVVREQHDQVALQHYVDRSAELLAAGDLDGASAMLASANRYKAAGGKAAAAMYRNLGVASLMRNKGGEAVSALQASSELAPDAITSMLLGRALALAGDRARARAAFVQAAKLAARQERVEVAIERASFELAAGDATAAAAELEEASGAVAELAAGDPEHQALAERYRAARTSARHVAGVELLGQGQASRALAMLSDGAAPEAPMALRCDYALALLAARGGDSARQLKSLGKLECGFSAQGGDPLKILATAADAETPGKGKAAVAALQRLEPRPGAGRALWSGAMRVAAQNAAADALRQAQRQSGEARAAQLAVAREQLRIAQRAQARFGDDELELSRLAVELEAAFELPDRLANPRIVAALPALERLAQRMPEAELFVGLAYNRQSRLEVSPAADELSLAAWRRARRAGVRWPQLSEWIRAKERLLPRDRNEL